MNRESSRMTVTLTAAGSERWIVVEPGADALDDRDGVLAHRAADVEHAPPASSPSQTALVGRSKLSSA